MKYNIQWKHTLILITILLSAGFLRLWQLNSIPSGIHQDEADIGYIAYSLLHTGATPYGDRNLFAIDEAWGGSRPPLYIYSVIPSIAAFGMSPFAVRFPSVIYGILSILVFYLLLKHVFKSHSVATIGAFLFAINPWAIQISRQGLLESIALFFILFGTYIFIIAQKRSWMYVLSSILFSLSLFSYDAPKIFLPLFIPILFVVYRNTLIKSRKGVSAFLGICILAFLLMYQTTFINKQSKDFQSVSLIDWKEISTQVVTERNQTEAPLWASKIFHNKATVLSKKILTSYVQVFSFNWMFVNGQGNLQQSTARQGEYHFFELVLFFIGLSFVIANRIKGGFIFILWMLLGAFPGGLTTGNYPYRSVLLLPAPLVFSSLGCMTVISWMKTVRKPIQITLSILFLGSVLMFLSSYVFTYFFDYPVYASEWWSKQQNDGIKQVIRTRNNYTTVYIDGTWESSYAFISQTDPKIFQSAYQNKKTFKDTSVMQLDNVIIGNFRNALTKNGTSSGYFKNNSLLITDNPDFNDYTPKQIFTDPGNVRVIYRLIETNTINQ